MWKKFFRLLLNERGAVGPDGKEIADPPAEKLLPQSQVNAIVEDRLARERAKFADYDDLRKFKSEHEKQLDEAKQKELEAQKEYEKLKEGWTVKEKELQGLISKKDADIANMKISGALMTEITKQNAYAEETMALLQSQAVFDKEGNIRIKGRDANGLEIFNSIEEGVKQFLTQRPHLVRVTQRNGGGTPPGTPPGGDADKDRSVLQNELMDAQRRGDHKKVQEITQKIRARLTS